MWGHVTNNLRRVPVTEVYDIQRPVGTNSIEGAVGTIQRDIRIGQTVDCVGGIRVSVSPTIGVVLQDSMRVNVIVTKDYRRTIPTAVALMVVSGATTKDITNAISALMRGKNWLFTSPMLSN